ncbi:unnamed protein product [Periconia digitata]|uniref:Uncharacterized protein n=1 Tax=Periconia digitata TaxID=1303443 RepID=A0A9W4URN2_9PLEO|nr:unnamed protein product [Periconia digitata]
MRESDGLSWIHEMYFHRRVSDRVLGVCQGLISRAEQKAELASTQDGTTRFV